MTKRQIVKLNALIARHDTQWRAVGEYIVVLRDEWVPCILRAGGSVWDRNVYRATMAIQPLFIPFSSVQSLYMVAVDHQTGTWSFELSSAEEVALGVASVIRLQLPKLTPLTPVSAFRARAVAFLTRERDYRPEFRVERDLLGACCALGDLPKARQHLEAAARCLAQNGDRQRDDPYVRSLEEYRSAIDEGEERALALVRWYREEGCRLTQIPVDAVTGLDVAP